MTRFLLDTSTVSAAVWKVPDRGVLERLDEHGGECAICAAVWHELQFGTRRLARGARRETLQSFLEEVVKATFPILPYDDSAAVWHAEERARLERSGRTPPVVDGQIAAVAVTRGLSLVTGNVADFGLFRGVVVVDWMNEKPLQSPGPARPPGGRRR